LQPSDISTIFNNLRWLTGQKRESKRSPFGSRKIFNHNKWIENQALLYIYFLYFYLLVAASLNEMNTGSFNAPYPSQVMGDTMIYTPV